MTILCKGGEWKASTITKYWGWPHPKTQIIIGKELWMALTFWANPQYTPTNNGQIQELPDTKQQRKLLKSIKNSWNKNDGVYPFANESAVITCGPNIIRLKLIGCHNPVWPMHIDLHLNHVLIMPSLTAWYQLSYM
jgi:hypothetical protein